MKKLVTIVVVCLAAISCNEKNGQGKFTLKGEIKNLPDQKVYLEQLYFSQREPEVLDTAEIKNGKFELSATAAEEGLFRIRLEKIQHGFIFINDQPQINFFTDIKDVSIEKTDFNTAANASLKKFLVNLTERSKEIEQLSVADDSSNAVSDSLQYVEYVKRARQQNELKKYIVQFIDTTSDPVVAMFALGYTRDADPAILKQVIPGLAKRFPNHSAVSTLVAQYNMFLAQEEQEQVKKKGIPGIGDMAPEITMNDVEGRPVSLSSFKGKYVLVDFWASWCGPCRGENPNVVAAYDKYKDKNFTILGISLDDDKNAWIRAIKNDGLVWQQVSDLKGWYSEAIPLYGFNGIPYNVLVDPQGKIIATRLRGDLLDSKLNEVLK